METQYKTFLERTEFFVNQIINGEYENTDKLLKQAVNALKYASFTIKILTDKEEKPVVEQFNKISELFKFEDFEVKDNFKGKSLFEYRSKSDSEQNRGVMGILPVPKGVEADKIVQTFTGMCFVELRVKRGLGYFCDLSKYTVKNSTYLFFKIEGPAKSIESMQKGIKSMLKTMKKRLNQVDFKGGKAETTAAKQMLHSNNLSWLIYRLKED